MATAPIRPKAYANWLTEVTATTPAPADARHPMPLWPGCTALHALVSDGVVGRARLVKLTSFIVKLTAVNFTVPYDAVKLTA